MDDQQSQQSRQIHAVESAVGLAASPFVYHAGGSLINQEQKMAAHYDALHIQQQQHMHQHLTAVSQMQQATQMMPQMIHISGQQIRDVQTMQLQDQSYQFFQPLPLSNTMQIGRGEEMHRPASLSYPINTIFGGTEDKNNCCLLDRGTRCTRAAGTAGFTHRIRELVARNGALLSEDATAGHQYICDHHKNYIQKLRVILPPGSYLSPNLGQNSSFFSPFTSFPSSYTVDSIIQQPMESDDLTSNDGVGRTDTSNGKKKDFFSETNSAPVDMRKIHSTENRHKNLSVSPEKEDSTGESSDESETDRPASDLTYGLSDVFSMDDLINYVKHFEIDVPPHPTKDELYRVMCEHMDTVPVNEIQSTLTNFFHAVKTDTRAFNEAYKQSLSVDFDLSSDEEMMLIDGKTGPVNGETASDADSDSDAEEEMENGENFPEIKFDEETEKKISEIEKKISEINENIPVNEIERILLRYAIPTKNRLASRASDTESSSGEERKPAKRGHVIKKRQRTRNSSD